MWLCEDKSVLFERVNLRTQFMAVHGFSSYINFLVQRFLLKILKQSMRQNDHHTRCEETTNLYHIIRLVIKIFAQSSQVPIWREHSWID